MRNVAVNLGLLGDDSRTRPVVQAYVDTKHAAQPYVKVRPAQGPLYACLAPVEPISNPYLVLQKVSWPYVASCTTRSRTYSRTRTHSYSSSHSASGWSKLVNPAF